MKSIQSSLADFKPPVISAERRAEIEEWERREAARIRYARTKRAMIPSRYREASVSDCHPLIAQYAESPSGWLLIRGEVGRGKTHSACAILNACCEKYPVRFATMIDILRDLRAAYRGHDSEHAVISRYVNTRLLVIDDLGKEAPTEWALSKTFEILDERSRNEKPTVVTTQYSSGPLVNRLAGKGDIETAKAIVSRLSESQLIELKGNDRRYV